MLSCWHEEATKRLSFSELQAKFDNMLSTQGNNPYIDFSINPEKLCYTLEADESEAPLTSHLRLPSARTEFPSDLGIPSSRNTSCSSVKSLLQRMNDSARKSCSPLPTSEKLHASNATSLKVEGRVTERPSSMTLLHNYESLDNRYVKDPSLFMKTLASASDGYVMLVGNDVTNTCGHVTNPSGHVTVGGGTGGGGGGGGGDHVMGGGGRKGGSDGVLNLTSGGAIDISNPLPALQQLPKIEIIES